MPWGVAAAAVVGAVAANNASKKAADASDRASQTASNRINTSTAQARGDLFKLFPSAQQAGQQGFQGALDVFGNSVPAQQQAFQGGNVAAQNQILAGLPQIQNALLGNQVDLSQLQAYEAPQQDLSFLNQQLPVAENAALNGGLGPFSATNPVFNGVMGPFQTGNPSIYEQMSNPNQAAISTGSQVQSPLSGTSTGRPNPIDRYNRFNKDVGVLNPNWGR